VDLQNEIPVPAGMFERGRWRTLQRKSAKQERPGTKQERRRPVRSLSNQFDHLDTFPNVFGDLQIRVLFRNPR
jgi:hypothetical protein